MNEEEFFILVVFPILMAGPILLFAWVVGGCLKESRLCDEELRKCNELIKEIKRERKKRS